MGIKTVFSRDRSCSIVPLTGGFGNQLFQYAFGIFLVQETGRRTLFDLDIGQPRRVGQTVALAGISTSQLPPIFLSHQSSFLSKVFTRAYGWKLSSSLPESKDKVKRAFILNIASKVLLQMRVRRSMKILASKDLGYDVSMELSQEGIYIGYFQTFVYASNPNVMKVLKSITPNILSSKYFSIRDEIVNSKPLLLHLRLTDYLQEDKFGIPSVNYYRKSLNLLRQTKTSPKVWVFSDDMTVAKEVLNDLGQEFDLHFFEQQDLSDLEVWDLMRHFDGYIISNSSFAWWGAFLRINQSAPVCAPTPWFQGMHDPTLLLPPKWFKVPSL